MIKSLKLKYVKSIMSACLLVVLSCGSTPSALDEQGKKDEYLVTGIVKIAVADDVFNPKPSPNHLVALYTMDEEGMILIDSSRTDNAGKYTLRGKSAELTGVYISLGDEYQFPLFVKNGDKLETNVSIGNRLVYDVKGTKISEGAALALKHHFDQRHAMSDLNDSLRGLKVDKSNKPKIDSLSALFETRMRDFENKRNTGVNSVLNANKDNLLGAFILLKMTKEPTIPQMEMVHKNIVKSNPNNVLTKTLGARIKAEKPTAIGEIAPDIKLAGPKGDTISLYSLRGKYVLIDFWASWCKPCRAENPNNVRLYKQYKAKGFEIFGVSLDNNANNWKEAIRVDGLEWVHVSDLAGWQSVAGKAYNVSSIPFTLLIDPQGKIVAKNLRGQGLADKLAEILK